MSFQVKNIVPSRTHPVKLSHSTGYQLSRSLRVLSVDPVVLGSQPVPLPAFFPSQLGLLYLSQALG